MCGLTGFRNDEGFMDKKCLNCPIRKIALKSTLVLQSIFNDIEKMFDVLSDKDFLVNTYSEYFKEIIKK